MRFCLQKIKGFASILALRQSAEPCRSDQYCQLWHWQRPIVPDDIAADCQEFLLTNEVSFDRKIKEAILASRARF